MASGWTLLRHAEVGAQAGQNHVIVWDRDAARTLTKLPLFPGNCWFGLQSDQEPGRDGMRQAFWFLPSCRCRAELCDLAHLLRHL